jgi:CCR4-NOT transcription complex subunit 7/8
VKLLTAQSLPTSEDAFFALLKIWFPTVYDIKFLMKASKALKGGLQEVADDLGVCYRHCHEFPNKIHLFDRS